MQLFCLSLFALFSILLVINTAVTCFDLDQDDAPNDFIGDIDVPTREARAKFIKENLMQWFEQHMPPEMMQGWRLAETLDAGWGVFATRLLPAGKPALTIPRSLRVHPETLCAGFSSDDTPNPLCELLFVIEQDSRSKNPHSAFRTLLRATAQSNFPILLTNAINIQSALILANIKFCVSCRNDPLHWLQMKWKTWVDHLEVKPGLPVCSYNHSQLTDEAFPLSEVVRRRRRLYEQQYEMVMALLRRERKKSNSKFSSAALHDEEWLTLPKFLWAMCAVISRIYSSGGVLPLIDSVNFDSRFEMRQDSERGQVSFIMEKKHFANGEEIRWNYFDADTLPDLFVQFGMVDDHDPCVHVNISNRVKLHPRLLRMDELASRAAKGGNRFLPAEAVKALPKTFFDEADVVACFRPVDDELLPRGADDVLFLTQRVQRQMLLVEKCLALAQTTSIRQYCKTQMPLLVQLLNVLRHRQQLIDDF